MFSATEEAIVKVIRNRFSAKDGFPTTSSTCVIYLTDTEIFAATLSLRLCITYKWPLQHFMVC